VGDLKILETRKIFYETKLMVLWTDAKFGDLPLLEYLDHFWPPSFFERKCRSGEILIDKGFRVIT
jgi:hypothetical protein